MKAFLAFSVLYLLFLSLPVLALAQVKQKMLPPKQAEAVPNDSLKIALEIILQEDQGVRKKLSTTPPSERMQLFREMRQIDSVNQVKVKAILNRYGWLPQSKVGEKAADALFFVVQHADTDLMEKYLPELQRLAQQGEARKTHAAMMEDRILMNRRKKQIYGTQAFSNQLTQGRFLIWPIADYPNVNKRRQEAGFDTTVEENAKRLNSIYNPSEIIPGLLAE